jgi:Fur family zinc uptake transcriptional regulator
MRTDCAHPGHEHGLNPAGVAVALQEAEARCAANAERLTPPRRRVLELLLGVDGPVKAYDLMAGFGEAGVPAKPPTVYRALDFLEKQGFAHRIESLNAYVACRHPLAQATGETHAAAFLICDCCGATREVEPLGAAEMRRLSTDSGYEVRSLVLEARGLCGACR